MLKKSDQEKRSIGNIYWFLFAIVGIFIDFATKYWADSSLVYGVSVELTPFLNWTLLYNEGAAFSFLAEHSGWQRWFFVGISLSAAIFISFWILRTKSTEKMLLAGLSMVLAGAVGNLIDRFFLGYVIDFIHLYYHEFHWPVFNVADILVSLGVILIILSSFTEKK